MHYWILKEISLIVRELSDSPTLPWLATLSAFIYNNENGYGIYISFEIQINKNQAGGFQYNYLN